MGQSLHNTRVMKSLHKGLVKAIQRTEPRLMKTTDLCSLQYSLFILNLHLSLLTLLKHDSWSPRRLLSAGQLSAFPQD